MVKIHDLMSVSPAYEDDLQPDASMLSDISCELSELSGIDSEDAVSDDDERLVGIFPNGKVPREITTCAWFCSKTADKNRFPEYFTIENRKKHSTTGAVKRLAVGTFLSCSYATCINFFTLCAMQCTWTKSVRRMFKVNRASHLHSLGGMQRPREKQKGAI